MFKEIRVKRKEKRKLSLNPGSAIKIKIKYSTLFPKLITDYIIPEIEDEEKPIKLPKDDLILHFSTRLGNKQFTTDSPASTVSYWLNLFCIYGKEFCATYDEYILDPDNVVSIIDDVRDYIKANLKLSIRTEPFTSSNIKATCHLIFISMNKGFATGAIERDRQIRTYLQNRKSAVYSSMRVSIGDLSYKEDFIIEISECFRMLPKLKKTLFFFCYLNQKYLNLAQL